EKLIVQVSTYESADPTVDSQMIQLKNSGADTFFNITTPKFGAQAIRKAADIAWKPVHYLPNIASSVGGVMKPAGYENGQGIITAQYRKDALDPQWASSPDVIAFKAFMAKYMPSSDIRDDGHTYGYAVAHLMLHVLEKCGDDLTRANVMKQAASLNGFQIPLLIPGILAHTSPTDYYPVESERLARFEGESWKLFGDIISFEST
ncbi:MAG: ABC transporter substrate-binding protein, partial [Proteobacteria bacterium]|nr:ABC transporter substrate-binding protein [Pseudomonadota bacterium]